LGKRNGGISGTGKKKGPVGRRNGRPEGGRSRVDKKKKTLEKNPKIWGVDRKGWRVLLLTSQIGGEKKKNFERLYKERGGQIRGRKPLEERLERKKKYTQLRTTQSRRVKTASLDTIFAKNQNGKEIGL